MNAVTGEIIKVKVSGEEFDTYIDEDGVQRFLINKFYRYLIDSKSIDLNSLGSAYAHGCFSEREYMLLNMGLGYSVCGFSDLSSFQHLEVENPLWDKV